MNETSQPQAQIYSSSVKIESTARGAAMVTVHVYDNDDSLAQARAVALYKNTIEQLKASGLAVAMEVAK